MAQKVNPINQNNKYKALVKKQIQLEPNDWPKFQKHLQKLHSADFQLAQTQQQEVTNKKKSKEVVQGKTHIEFNA